MMLIKSLRINVKPITKDVSNNNSKMLISCRGLEIDYLKLHDKILTKIMWKREDKTKPTKERLDK